MASNMDENQLKIKILVLDWGLKKAFLKIPNLAFSTPLEKFTISIYIFDIAKTIVHR